MARKEIDFPPSFEKEDPENFHPVHHPSPPVFPLLKKSMENKNIQFHFQIPNIIISYNIFHTNITPSKQLFFEKKKKEAGSSVCTESRENEIKILVTVPLFIISIKKVFSETGRKFKVLG